MHLASCRRHVRRGGREGLVKRGHGFAVTDFVDIEIERIFKLKLCYLPHDMATIATASEPTPLA